MYATYPVYYPSSWWARENGEIDLWRESYRINNICRDYINRSASRAYHDKNLSEYVANLTETYGLERVMYVIGRTVVESDWDKRYEKDVRDRVNLFNYMDMKEGRKLRTDHTESYLSNVHPCILNDMFRSLMKMEREQINLPDANYPYDKELDEGVEQ